MLHGVGGLLSLTVISDVSQGDNLSALYRIAFLHGGADRAELIAGVGLLGQAAFLDHNGRIGLVNPCGAGVGVAVLFLSTYDVLHSVGGGLGLRLILDVGQDDSSAALDCLAFLCVAGSHALEPVAGVGLLCQAACLDHNGRIGFVNPRGAGVGVAVLFPSTYNVLHSVVGGLGLRLILDVGQDDSSAALDCLAFLCVAGSHALEPVAGVGLLLQAAFLDHNGRIGFVDPCGAGVGVAVLFLSTYNVLHSVGGGLGLACILYIVQHHHISLSADFQRLRLCGIKFITGDFNFMVSCVHGSAQCLIGNQHLTAQLIVRALLQIRTV